MGTAPSGTNSAVYQTPQGELTVNSVPAAPTPMAGPAPTFEQLSAGGKAISEEQAAASPPGHGNFEMAPSAFRDPYEYSVPGSAADFTPQFSDRV